MQITFTDAERRFADSAEGRMQLALAARDHQAREAHKGTHAMPWTDARAAEAIRRLSASHARQTVHGGAIAAATAATVAAATVAADRAATATAGQADALNGWRGR